MRASPSWTSAFLRRFEAGHIGMTFPAVLSREGGSTWMSRRTAGLRPQSAFFVDINEQRVGDAEAGIQVTGMTVVMDVPCCSTVSAMVTFSSPDLRAGGE